MITELRAIQRCALGQIKHSFSRSMMQFVVLVQPVILTSISCFMFRHSRVPAYGEYVVVGSSLMTLWMTILWSSATDINRERWMGTFDLILIAPVSFPTVLLGKILGNTVLGLLAVGITCLYAMALGVSIPVNDPGALALALAGSVFSLVGFSLTLALLFTLSREASRIANGLSYPIYLVSGLFFPLNGLPAWARVVGLFMPLSWAKETLRWAAVGPSASPALWTPSYEWALCGLLVLGALYFLAAFCLVNYLVETRLRQEGKVG